MHLKQLLFSSNNEAIYLIYQCDKLHYIDLLICLELCARVKRVCRVEILFQQRVKSLVSEYKFGKSCKKCFVQTDFALTIIRDNKFIIA